MWRFYNKTCGQSFAQDLFSERPQIFEEDNCPVQNSRFAMQGKRQNGNYSMLGVAFTKPRHQHHRKHLANAESELAQKSAGRSFTDGSD